MPSPDREENAMKEDVSEAANVEQIDLIATVNSSLKEIKESLDRLTKSVGELNSKLRSTGDTLRWVLDALSRRSEEKETLYLKNFEASTELLKNFMSFVESRIRPLAKDLAPGLAAPKKEQLAKETSSVATKRDDYLVKPSLIRRLQEEEGKDKDKKSR